MKVIYVVTNIIIIRRRDICRPPRGTRLAMTKGRLLHSVVHSSVVGGIQVLPAANNEDFQLLLLVVPIPTTISGCDNLGNLWPLKLYC